MHAEVISIGDELTSGQRLDTNSQWLSERLGELGIRVLYHSTVGDDLTANERVFREAFNRSDVILATGGLGPTADDLTRQALAAATNTELVLDEDSLQHIRALFARRKREMPERNVIQAQFPAGARVIPNPHGSAPGIDMHVSRKTSNQPSRIFALPGVPAEMREMWEATVEPALRSTLGAPKVIRHRRVKCFGVGESDLEQMLPDLIRRGRQPSVGITVSHATITLRITAEAQNAHACQELMKPTLGVIHESLGNLVFGHEDDELQHAVIRLLDEQKQTLAVAERGTGGLISNWLSDVPGSDGVFLGAIVDRSTDSGEAAVADSAKLARQTFHADFGLGISSFPVSDSESTSPGVVHFAVAGANGQFTKSAPFAGHPDILKSRAAKQALNLLRLHLLGSSEATP